MNDETRREIAAHVMAPASDTEGPSGIYTVDRISESQRILATATTEHLTSLPSGELVPVTEGSTRRRAPSGPACFGWSVSKEMRKFVPILPLTQAPKRLSATKVTKGTGAGDPLRATTDGAALFVGIPKLGLGVFFINKRRQPSSGPAATALLYAVAPVAWVPFWKLTDLAQAVTTGSVIERNANSLLPFCYRTR